MPRCVDAVLCVVLRVDTMLSVDAVLCVVLRVDATLC